MNADEVGMRIFGRDPTLIFLSLVIFILSAALGFEIYYGPKREERTIIDAERRGGTVMQISDDVYLIQPQKFGKQAYVAVNGRTGHVAVSVECSNNFYESKL